MQVKVGDLVCFDPEKLTERQKRNFNLRGVWLLIEISSFIPGIVTILDGDQRIYTNIKFLKRYVPKSD